MRPRRRMPAAMRSCSHRSTGWQSSTLDVVATWSAILLRTPGSCLHLGARLLDDPQTRTYTLARFAAQGIDADRLVLNGQRPYAELLAAYRGVDIALDPFPFSGCTTTCDALYMGSAVVTLPGETFVSRQSASLLRRLGQGRLGRARSRRLHRARRRGRNKRSGAACRARNATRRCTRAPLRRRKPGARLRSGLAGALPRAQPDPAAG